MPLEYAVVVSLAAVVVLLAVSAFFSSTEIALFSLTPERLDELAAGDERGQRLKRLRDDPHRLLVTILVGNNVVNIATSSILTVLLVAYLPPQWAVVGTTLVATSLVLVCGEILPKSWGLANADTWALTAARPLQLVGYALWPLVVFFDTVTRRLAGVTGGSPDIERELLEED
ncbi:MAG: CNNM domain-containing protein [Halobacterium sp.]